MNEDEIRRVAETVAAKVRGEMYEFRSDLKASDEWATWKGLPPKWRRALVILPILSFLAGVVLMYVYYGAPM